MHLLQLGSCGWVKLAHPTAYGFLLQNHHYMMTSEPTPGMQQRLPAAATEIHFHTNYFTLNHPTLPPKSLWILPQEESSRPPQAGQRPPVEGALWGKCGVVQ